ncbi:MAG: UvrD-helicase domain-containing protein, partial [Candidatus Omnitrophica bacterium]|nr:UvrD-helicase domain-containing protein [Candidatus Omnitrophota bacterium]
MKPIDNPSDIDLTKHGVIEASAGTGKTYTLENLVVRILVEERVPIEKILLVTFTEKATGEMG